MILKRFFFAAAISLFFLSCSKNSDGIQLQIMTAEELSPSVEWALITDPYVACRENAGYEFSASSSFRKGEIFKLEGSRTVEISDEMPDGKKNVKKETWLAVSGGWIPSSAARIFSNKLKAQSARNAILK